MTAPRDPNEPSAVPADAPGDPSATARMPLPDPSAPDGTPDGPTPWTPPAADWTPPPGPEPAAPSPPEPAPPPAWTTPPPAAPTWKPARTDDGRGPSLVFGLILVAVGLWFFAEHTLGLDLPNLRWSQLWPVILIVIGAWVLFGARRRTR